MKKLLLTFVAFIAIVSCQKEPFDMDVMPEGITPIEAEVSADDIDVDGLIERLVSSTRKNNSKSGSETAKDAVAGTSYISLYTGVISGDLYEIAFDDTQNHCAPANSGLTHLTLFYATNGNSLLKLGGSDGVTIVTLTQDLSFLYGLDIVQGVKINGTTRVAEQATLASNNFTFASGGSYNFACAAPAAPLTLGTPVVNGQVATVEYTLSAAAAASNPSLIFTSEPNGIVGSSVPSASGSTTGTITINRGTAPYAQDIIVTVGGVSGVAISFTINFGADPDVWTRSASRSTSSVDVYENPVRGAYEVFDAPGPLTGKLAKAIEGPSGAPIPAGVENFAADSEADVKTAIENSFITQ